MPPTESICYNCRYARYISISSGNHISEHIEINGVERYEEVSGNRMQCAHPEPNQERSPLSGLPIRPYCSEKNRNLNCPDFVQYVPKTEP